MQLGLFTRAYQDLELDDCVKRASLKHGIYNLEITANYSSKHISILNPNYQKLNDLVSKYNVRYSGLAIHRDSQLLLGARGKEMYHFYPYGINEQKEYANSIIKKSAKVANELKIPVVVGNIGCENFSDLFEWPCKNSWKNQLDNAKKKWMPLLEYYDKLGVKFAHEIAPQQLAYDLESSLELLNVFENIPSFGFCVDPSQLLYTGVNVSECIETLGDKVFNFHAKDAEFTHKRDRMGYLPNSNIPYKERAYRSRIPGWGDSDWKKIITSLKIIEFKGPINIEIEDNFIDTEEAIKKSVEYLKPILL